MPTGLNGGQRSRISGREYGDEGVRALLRRLQEYSIDQGVTLSDALLNTPYINTLSPDEQPPYPGDLELEKRIENIIRWNAAAMILRAQDEGAGLGGHIATYASAATAMETAFHHVFSAEGRGDLVLPQPHAAPGIYARAYLEGRLTEQQLRNFRRELGEGGGLPSYPHPRSYAGILAGAQRFNGSIRAHVDLYRAFRQVPSAS
jgi:pyruvate dehydrogenase E1 component